MPLLTNTFRVRPQSNNIGLRLDAPPIERTRTDELQSRGVPIGAVEVPPTGGIIILLRGRLVTAGYPVIAVVTTESLDLLGQVRPGDEVAMTFCDSHSARQIVRAKARERARADRPGAPRVPRQRDCPETRSSVLGAEVRDRRRAVLHRPVSRGHVVEYDPHRGRIEPADLGHGSRNACGQLTQFRSAVRPATQSTVTTGISATTRLLRCRPNRRVRPGAAMDSDELVPQGRVTGPRAVADCHVDAADRASPILATTEAVPHANASVSSPERLQRPSPRRTHVAPRRRCRAAARGQECCPG